MGHGNVPRKLHFRRPIRRGYQRLASSPTTYNTSTISVNDHRTMTWSGNLKLRALGLLRRFIDMFAGCLFWLVYCGSRPVIPPIRNLLLMESATALAFKIRIRKLKSEEVVEAFIARIKEVNSVLNCVVDNRFELALAEARAVDKLIESGDMTEKQLENEKPFLGVPFTTKDAISVKDQCFTAGLYRRKDIKGERDAEVIALMRKAGGIPLAITNVSEVCMWWESHNTVHGRTNNPYNVNHIVGGSSGGEACIQAAAASPMGIGSDIGGSIRMPCFFNGIFGHKPSRGIVSNDGEHPVPSKTHDTYLGTGPMCKFAVDLMPMFKVLVAKNINKLKLNEKVDISKLKIYYMEDDGGCPLTSAVHPEIRSAMKKALAHLEKSYGIKSQKVRVAKMERSIAIWLAKMRIEGHPDFCQQLANLEGSINLSAELSKWVLGMSNHTLIALLTGLTERLGVQPGTPKYQHLFELCDHMHQEFQEMLGDDGVFFYPTHPTPAPYHNEPLVKPFNFAYTAIINVLGLPATACPLGLSTDGLPIGIQVVAALNQDHLTLAMALELERAFGGWVPPSIEV